MKKRLKIAEQISIVLIVALILPLVIAGAIIVNTNQIAVRKELISSAEIIARSVANEISALKKFEKRNILYSYEALKRISSPTEKDKFLNFMKVNQPDVIDFYIYQLPQRLQIENKYVPSYMKNEKSVVFSLIYDDNVQISKKVNLDYVYEQIFDDFNSQGRQVYILDEDKELIFSLDYEQGRYEDILANFPVENVTADSAIVFYKYKNQPNVLIYDAEFKWYIVVASPKYLTYYGIIDARRKIIFAICVAAAVVFVLFGIYTISLYVNIRQFFKIIKSIAEGNYAKKIRVLTTAFTSQELIFIADEFNKMVKKIDKSYKKLHETNKKLKKMDEYKSNLIDTVSHEFRTPLTSIKGYASSLLRHDINIDDESRKKSLKIIKQQTERLSRMVEDLLVIPDIEAASLRMNYKELNLKNVIETSILSTSSADTNLFNVDIQEPLKNIYSDEDRLIQIFINLLENAVKYSKENTPIEIKAFSDDEFVTVKVKNEADKIDEKTLKMLFEKFTRVEANLTRTTRGTGLGLFIVKGLIETMGGRISLKSDDGFEVIFTIPTYKGQDNAD